MITVSDVKQYLYCPKIIYFDHVLHIPKPPDEKLKTGKDKHDSITAREKRRKGAIFYDPELDGAEKMFRVELESSTLGLRGVLDYLVRTDREFIPVDYKFGHSHKGSVQLNHKYQLAAYALLVEESFKTVVRRGFIHYSRDPINVRIDLDDEIRRRTLKVIREIAQIIEDEIEPAGTRNSSRCIDCEYRKYCIGHISPRPNPEK
ncbi:MAG: CRISPR-associated protein Cas4 [Methanothrix sp.]|jgi:CRISPR-associated exonuclease Cas4|uniref:CRISPR-associated protein Cas4 n=2 Tax=Methanothrix sp. TaxID=90426 RepID=UPI001BD6620B|nr:CRISPR-associated protein Cas4 [Euryarchaeota archaeon]HON36463.1 CRISPR-associated protein Cas4 [Methanothrix sp.]